MEEFTFECNIEDINSELLQLLSEYGVNRLAKSLHPGTFKAKIINKENCGVDSCKISFAPIDSFPYFRAGQFITLSKKVNDSFLSRPYS